MWTPVETTRLYKKGDIIRFQGKQWKIKATSTRMVNVRPLKWWERALLWLVDLMLRRR